MIRATNVLGQHRWTQSAADTVVLDFDDRHRRRMAMTGTRGLEFLLDLENAVALRGGDALVLEDGRLIEVVAAAEPLLEIRGADPLHLVRVAWHLGNRHLPTQIMPKGLRIRRDHVIEAMVKGLGARIIEIEAPFDPEGGAYAASQAPDSHVHGHAAHDGSDPGRLGADDRADRDFRVEVEDEAAGRADETGRFGRFQQPAFQRAAALRDSRHAE